MKSINVRKVGAVLGGAALLGAAVSGPVYAGLNDEGITKGFFYDSEYKPAVQIVVGEGSMLSDAIVAGNIAATIGNLAYYTKVRGPDDVSYAPKGRVVITTGARVALGDYVQAAEAGGEPADYYDPDAGLRFSGNQVYEKGDFFSYALSCQGQTTTEADILKDGSYSNIHCLFCHNMCMESLKNPSHDMKEKLAVDSSKITYYYDGVGESRAESLRMALEKNAISYTVETGYIPLKRLVKDPKKYKCSGEDCYIDFEYRGKMLLFGDEYYVKDVNGDKIYLAKGKVLEGVSSEGYTAEYKGYRFKIENLVYSSSYTFAGIVLNVYKPDGSIAQVKISKMANGLVDDMEIAGVYANEGSGIQTAAIIVYDLSSQVILENGEDLKMGSKTYKNWRVSLETVDYCKGTPGCDIKAYDQMDPEMSEALLKSVSITYNRALEGSEALKEGGSLELPNGLRLTFKGYLTKDYEKPACSGEEKGGIKVERGEPHQLLLSLTGSDGNRYERVRIDEGPYKKNELFILNGEIYKYESYETDKKSSGAADDTATVTLDPQIRGTKIRVKDMQRFCDPDDRGDPLNQTYTQRSCSEFGNIRLLKAALVDATNDENPAKYKNDKELSIEPEDLFIKADALNGRNAKIDVLYYDRDKTVIFAQDYYDRESGTINDTVIEITDNMPGVFTDYKDRGYVMRMEVIKESGSDQNGDGDTDDALLAYKVASGTVVVDYGDRDYSSADGRYSTGLTYYDANMKKVAGIYDDADYSLLLPEGGDKFTAKWGSRSRLDSLTICHPMERAYPTYFIGKSEEETFFESVLTKEDEGKDVWAACCRFTVSEFGVSAEEEAGEYASTAVVNPVLGSLVVPEALADKSRNLILVGGPAVNSLTKTILTREEISAESDRFTVKKSGNMIVVAGWEAGDTVAAGNALIEWLTANAH